MAKRKFRSIESDVFGHEVQNNRTHRKSKQKNLEKKLSYQIAEYLKLQYPKVKFRFDVGADVRLTMGQSVIVKDKLRHDRGYHDLTVLEARGGYFGLLIELKKDKSEVFRKDGKLKRRFNQKTQSCHNEEQYTHLKDMTARGYWAGYGFGFDHTKEIIDKYMSKDKTSTR